MLDVTMIGQIMQFHVDQGDPDTFVVGRLMALDSKWFLIQSISVYGRWDGLALYPLADLVSIESEKEYIQKLSILLNSRNEKPPNIPYIWGGILDVLLEYALKNSEPIGLELHMSGERDVIGFISEICKNIVVIKQVNEYGKQDGQTILSTSAITRVFLNDDELKNTKILAMHHGTGTK